MLAESQFVGKRKNLRKINWLDLIELGYFLYFWYSMFSVSLRIAIPNFGAIWLLGLSFFCIPFFNWKRIQSHNIFITLFISFSHIFIQLFIYNQSITNGYIINYLWWPVSVLVISTLMQRKNFFKRLIINMLLVAIIWSPFVSFTSETGVERITLEIGNALSNANAYASWIGFCILVLWLWSQKTKSKKMKYFLWGIAFISFLLALRSISRGFIIALGISIAFSFRKMKVNKVITYLFIFLAFLFILITFVPFFHNLYYSYNVRFLESTSRFDVLSLSMGLIAKNPLFGYGISKMRGLLPITPHNEILLLWLSSGIIPVVFYVTFIVYIFKLANQYEKNDFSVNPLPLIVFIILEIPTSNLILSRLWAVGGVSYLFSLANYVKRNKVNY